MSANVQGTTIYLTRGDTLSLNLYVAYTDGSPYEKTEGDVCWFSVKRTYDRDEEYLIHKQINLDTMTLFLESSDTEVLEYGEYKYDIQMELVNGVVDTIVPRSTLVILEEVT